MRETNNNHQPVPPTVHTSWSLPAADESPTPININDGSARRRQPADGSIEPAPPNLAPLWAEIADDTIRAVAFRNKQGGPQAFWADLVPTIGPSLWIAYLPQAPGGPELETKSGQGVVAIEIGTDQGAPSASAPPHRRIDTARPFTVLVGECARRGEALRVRLCSDDDGWPLVLGHARAGRGLDSRMHAEHAAALALDLVIAREAAAEKEEWQRLRAFRAAATYRPESRLVTVTIFAAVASTNDLDFDAYRRELRNELSAFTLGGPEVGIETQVESDR